MLGFSPFKKHANKFNYRPRYYDPDREGRDQRRAELRGEKAGDAGEEYTPGQYIRTQRDARADRRQKELSSGRGRIWMMIALGILVVLFLLFGYPRLVEALTGMQQTNKETVVEEFDPYAPITIVPNDYAE